MQFFFTILKVTKKEGIIMNRYAYIRVSSKDQNLDRQAVAMYELGLTKKQIFYDKDSGKNMQRKGYQTLLRKLKKGDVLYIKSIDRLGRDYDQIIEQWRYLIKVKEIDIIVLDFPLLNTKNQMHGVTGKLLSDIVLQLLSYIAQMERENIKQRQAEGIKAAKAKGVKFGRPMLTMPRNFEEVYRIYKCENISKRECARRLQTNHATFSNWIQRYEIQQKDEKLKKK